MISEANGYGNKGRRPAGRSIVEERSHNCKLTVWAQDLRAETLYSIYMLFEDGGRYAGVPMGTLSVDEKGKAEVRREFEHEELGSFNLSDIVAVAVMVKGASGIISPLCGYKGDMVTWRHLFYEYKRATAATRHEETPARVDAHMQAGVPETPNSTNIVAELPQIPHISDTPPVADMPPVLDSAPTPTVDTVPIAEVTPATDTASAENNHHKSNITEECPPTERRSEPSENHQNSTPDNIPEGETPPPLNENTPPLQDEWQMSPPQNPEEPTYDPTPIRQHTQAQKPKSEIAKSFRQALDQLHADTIQRSAPPTEPPPHPLEAIFANKKRVTPFQKQSRKTHWIEFNLSDQVPPPTNRPNLFKDSFIKKALEEYGHLILGMTAGPGQKRYIIGVPDNPSPESRQRARRLGFTQFKRCEESNPQKGDPGYWLMFITTQNI